MPPKKTTGETSSAGADDGGILLTPTDIKMIDCVMKTAAGPKPNADWEKVTKDMGLKNEKTAKERFRQICKKYNWFESTGNADNPEGTAATPTPKKAPAKRAGTKRAKSTPGDDSAAMGDDEAETPVKKRKANPKKPVVEEPDVNEPEVEGPAMQFNDVLDEEVVEDDAAPSAAFADYQFLFGGGSV